MLDDARQPVDMARLQDMGHGKGHDYATGSPHLMHNELMRRVSDLLSSLLVELFSARPAVSVLEIGAGHGTFSDLMLAAGAKVTMTEMSRASAAYLSERYAHNPNATVLLNEEAASFEADAGHYDLVVCVSVLHHIPDYLSAIRYWCDLIKPGGAFLTFADPLWHARRSRSNLLAHRGAFYTWRLSQPQKITGLQSFFRRAGGRFDESNPRDMVEYHALRDGCDEASIASVLERQFSAVEVFKYWATPAPLLQALGSRFANPSDFGVVCRYRNGNHSMPDARP